MWSNKELNSASSDQVMATGSTVGERSNNRELRRRYSTAFPEEADDVAQIEASIQEQTSVDDVALLGEFHDHVQEVLDGREEPYVCGDETSGLPDFAYETYEAKEMCRQIIKRAIEILHGAKFQGESTTELIRLLYPALKIKQPSPRRVGLVGPSGVGKQFSQLSPHSSNSFLKDSFCL